MVPDLAPMLWHSFGTMAALLQEIINIYPAINPPVADILMLILSMINSFNLQVLTAHQSNRVCNALALLQCVASHPDTRLETTTRSQHLGQQLVFTIDKLLTIPPVTGLHSSWRTSPSTSTPSSTLCPRPGLHSTIYLFLFF